MEKTTVKNAAGEFKVSLYCSRNSELKKPWVFLIESPDGERKEGGTRTRRGAERAIRRQIARVEAEYLLNSRQERDHQRATELLEEAGLSDWQISRLQRGREISCKQIRPGEIICLYKIEAISGERWTAVLYLDGEEAVSETSKSKKRAERAVRRGLQEIYQKEALRALKPRSQG